MSAHQTDDNELYLGSPTHPVTELARAGGEPISEPYEGQRGFWALLDGKGEAMTTYWEVTFRKGRWYSSTSAPKVTS